MSKNEEKKTTIDSGNNKKPYKDPLIRDIIILLCIGALFILASFFPVVRKIDLDKLFSIYGVCSICIAIKLYFVHLSCDDHNQRKFYDELMKKGWKR